MSVSYQRRIFHRPRIRESTAIKVGFFENARYPDGQQVSMVAFTLDFGLDGHVEYAFARKANEKFKAQLQTIVRQAFRGTNPDTTSEFLMSRIATQWQTLIQQSIMDEKMATGHLIDTGLMIQSVSYEVVE